ncbi:Site-specific DNA recombinase (fragment) [Beijerinckiaceae bacterium RH AL1]
MKGITRREFDLVAVWSICRLGRSLQDLVGFLAELQGRGVGLYSHTQALDTTTPSGRMVFGMISVFAEFERAMIRDRVLAGLARTKAKGTRLGRPPMETAKIEAIRSLLVAGTGIRETARRTGAGTASVMRIKQTLEALAA